MLTARNVVITTIASAVLSIAWMAYSLSRPPDSGGLGRDSYGTRSEGRRGIFEVLQTLGIPADRAIGPPTSVIGREATLVLWEPQAELVHVEPAYLRELSRWVESGGRVVIAPDSRTDADRSIRIIRQKTPKKPAKPEPPVKSAAEELGLPYLKLRAIDPKTGREPTPKPEPTTTDEVQRLRAILTNTGQAEPTLAVAVQSAGTLARSLGGVSKIQVPEQSVSVIEPGQPTPDGTLTFHDEKGQGHLLAASYRKGRGELIVVSAPEIAENRLLAQSDNSVLMVRLLAPGDRPVVFDEFYHGLTIRGNPLWLFAQPGYAATTLALIAAIMVWIWREAVFLGPPLDPAPRSRRTLSEYVDAMARFLNAGPTSRPFLLREFRSGVVRSIRDELHLPPSSDQVERIAAVLARRDPARSRELIEAIAAVDEALDQKHPPRESAAIGLFARLARCLPNRTTP